MKIFTDTNVLVSAFTARGLCADLLEVILTDHQLMAGDIVLDELQRVLTKKLKVAEKDVDEVLQFLRSYHVESMQAKQSVGKVSDKDDQWVLESAIQAKADILITGDKDRLVIDSNVSSLRIVTPREIWELLKK